MKHLPPFHPLILSIYPVTALLASNAAQVRPQVAARAALLSLAFGLVVYACLRWIVRDTGRAALLASLALVLFFTYGHVYGLVEGQQVLGLRVGRHLVLAAVWLLLLAGGGWSILRQARAVSTWNLVLNGSAAVLLVMVLVQLAPLGLRKDWVNAPASAPTEMAQSGLLSDADRPDVYYIILDAYGREDVLRERYGFDNQPFLDSLRALGFVIPECTQSNYANTVMSVSSTFYMQPLEEFSDLIARGDQERDWITYQGYLRDNPVRRNFESLGYKTVAFETGYWWGEISDADYYIVPNDNPLDSYSAGYEINEFEVMFLRTTLLRIASEAQTSLTARLF
ncbi:MAG TPA: hypothetical protein VHO48_09075, partial [Anaerolineaceae bacterium]|nr:hypothetical protein [Anaerolineaceae bacterium]